MNPLKNILDFSVARNKKFFWDKTVIVGAQHILASIHEMFLFLRSLGLNLSNVFLIGKCYSSSRLIYNQMKNSGIFVSPDSFSFNSHRSFDAQYKEYIDRFLEEVLLKINFKTCERIIILDDGGSLISAFQKEDIPKKVKIIGIEQTSAGYHFLNNNCLKIPIFNVARAKAKLNLETPHIIDSFLKKIYEYVSFHEMYRSNILVVGNGTIGKALIESLKGFSVEQYDKELCSKDMFLPLLSKSDIIFGCTGSKSIPKELHKFLKKGALLASLSSSDREFDSVYIRKNFPKNSNPLESYATKNLTLLQSGFPLNFWGTPHNIPIEKIAITVSLLTSTILSALRLESFDPKMIDIEKEDEESIISSYINQNNIGQTGT